MLGKAATWVVAATLAGHALAMNSHRHIHPHPRNHEKRKLHVETAWVTVWETVTVMDGVAQKTATADDFFVLKKPVSLLQTSSLAPNTTSSSSSALPAATPPVAPVAPIPPVVPDVPVAIPPPPIDIQLPDLGLPVPYIGGGGGPAPGGKRGLAYNDAGFINLFTPRCSWAYNWDSTDNGLSGAGVEFVPMLWGDRPEHTDRWHGNAERMLSTGSTHLVSFNEPDFPEQSNMSPEQAAAKHVEYMNQYGDRAQIGGPATTNSDKAGQGNDWLRQFIPACNAAGCRLDFCVTHWYAPIELASTLIEHLNNVHSICEGRPVWLTEFAPITGSDDQIAGFLAEYLPQLDALPWLQRYSYFMARPGSLIGAPGGLSVYGSAYVAL